MLGAVEYPNVALRRLSRNKVRVLWHVAGSVDFPLMTNFLGYVDWFRWTIRWSVPQFFRDQGKRRWRRGGSVHVPPDSSS